MFGSQRRKYAIILLWICIVIAISLVEGDTLLSEIDQCFEKNSPQSRKRRAKAEKSLFIDYGLGGIESIQGFGPYATRQVATLVNCVQTTAPQLYQTM